MPIVVQYCAVDDDELREYCLHAFESFVRRCPKEISSHVPTVRFYNTLSVYQYVKKGTNIFLSYMIQIKLQEKSIEV